ncbi:hypothetical protein LTR50_003360 [Elasticomyces elasticus]|nr:hypothetical protein LTR50_003360 [Elasticomyces elasticus]
MARKKWPNRGDKQPVAQVVQGTRLGLEEFFAQTMADGKRSITHTPDKQTVAQVVQGTRLSLEEFFAQTMADGKRNRLAKVAAQNRVANKKNSKFLSLPHALRQRILLSTITAETQVGPVSLPDRLIDIALLCKTIFKDLSDTTTKQWLESKASSSFTALDRATIPRVKAEYMRNLELSKVVPQIYDSTSFAAQEAERAVKRKVDRLKGHELHLAAGYIEGCEGKDRWYNRPYPRKPPSQKQQRSQKQRRGEQAKIESTEKSGQGESRRSDAEYYKSMGYYMSTGDPKIEAETAYAAWLARVERENSEERRERQEWEDNRTPPWKKLWHLEDSEESEDSEDSEDSEGE